MHILPQDFDAEVYWRDIYKQPLPFWQPALQEITDAHNLHAGEWTRASLGRNIVFLAPNIVIKLGPPRWQGEMARETAALNFVAGQLPVATPHVVATGLLDGWDYLIQERLPGTNLREGDLWKNLDDRGRATLAHQHGELMAAIHSLPLDDAPPILHFDWAEMLGEQRDCCINDMRDAGLDERLVGQAEIYLDQTPWQIEQGDVALLHGDLTHLNFLSAEVDEVWTITGIIDWGDVKIGAPSHEFISPGMHMYRGDRAALSQWYQGYPLLNRYPAPDYRAAYQHIVMARSMLYYPDSFANLIEKTPAAASCTSWSSLASVFLQMDMRNVS